MVHQDHLSLLGLADLGDWAWLDERDHGWLDLLLRQLWHLGSFLRHESGFRTTWTVLMLSVGVAVTLLVPKAMCRLMRSTVTKWSYRQLVPYAWGPQEAIKVQTFSCHFKLE